MDTQSILYSEEVNLTDLGINVPRWIAQDIDSTQVAAILQGGCASGAYMPAVTYHQALATMAEHGDDVLDYIEASGLGLTLPPEESRSWAGFAVHYLSTAVELWAGDVAEEAAQAMQDRAESE